MQSSPRWPPLAAASALTLCLCAVAGGACSRLTAEPSAVPRSQHPDRFPMDQSTSPRNAEDIGKRVLKFVENVHGRDDLSPQRIEQLTGLKVEHNPDDANEYGFSGQLTDAWAYNLVSLPDGNGAPSRIMFSFDDESRDNADMGPICGLDFDDYAAALAAAGYRIAPARGQHDRLQYWDFSRGDVSVQIYVRGENDDLADHACVSKLIVNA